VGGGASTKVVAMRAIDSPRDVGYCWNIHVLPRYALQLKMAILILLSTAYNIFANMALASNTASIAFMANVLFVRRHSPFCFFLLTQIFRVGEGPRRINYAVTPMLRRPMTMYLHPEACRQKKQQRKTLHGKVSELVQHGRFVIATETRTSRYIDTTPRKRKSAPSFFLSPPFSHRSPHETCLILTDHLPQHSGITNLDSSFA